MAAGKTYDQIFTTTLTTAVASLTISSIPAAYTDIRLVASCQLTGANNYDLQMQFNSDTASNYSRTYLYGDGTTAGSGRNSSTTSNTITSIVGTSASTYGFSVITADLMNYSNTSVYKTILGRGSNPINYTFATVGLWRSTAVINSMLLFPGSGSFNIGSSFTLYGIVAA